MDFKELKRALAAEAQAAGICSEWYARILNAGSKERLIALCFGGMDFVIENDYPSKALRQEFDGTRQIYNIFEDEAFSVKNPRKLIAFEGATGTGEFANFAVAQVWARKGSEVSITAKDNCYVTVDVAPGAKVNIKATDAASVIVFHHGGSITQEAEGKAKIRIIKK